ncbi:MAG: protein kinase domain-containing protein [Cellulosilyticaceae bacterium]
MVLEKIKGFVAQDHLYLINDQIEGYIIKRFLGEGRYGIAYLGQNTKGQLVVIKQLKRRMLRRARDRVHYEQDILKKLAKLGDKRFPKYLGKFTEGKVEGYILEYKAGKTFEKIIYEEKYVFSKEEIYEIGLQIIDIIKVLNHQQIVHKDIRVSNVICNQNEGIALIDFGLARFIDHKHYKGNEDYWYLADFLIHLYYTTYDKRTVMSLPWYKELDLTDGERHFLKRLMGLEQKYTHIDEVENDLEKLQIECIG